MNKLTITEQERLEQLEEVIEQGLNSSFRAGLALKEIRDKRLYKIEFANFETYLRKRWGLSRTYANHMISAQQIRDELTAIAVILPTTESQVRPLSKLKSKEKRAEAWDMAVEAAQNGDKQRQPTAAIVQAAVEELQEPKSSGNGGPLDPTLEVAWILEFLSAWTKKISEFENATRVGKFSPEAGEFVKRRWQRLILRGNQWMEVFDA